jgi:hypothetical protein
MKNLKIQNYLNFKMFVKFIKVFPVLLFISCQQTNKKDYESVLQLLINYHLANNLPLNSGSSVSVVDIKQTSLTIYNGYCQDSFTAINGSVVISADYYFQATGGSSFPNSGVEKKATSKSSCTALGFAGGFLDTDTSQKFSYRYYTCSPSSNICSITAIKAAGYTGPFQ